MSNILNFEIGKCEFCEQRAEVVFIRQSWITLNVRFYCHKCRGIATRVRDDRNANMWQCMNYCYHCGKKTNDLRERKGWCVGCGNLKEAHAGNCNEKRIVRVWRIGGHGREV